jgi:hypothetical protein
MNIRNFLAQSCFPQIAIPLFVVVSTFRVRGLFWGLTILGHLLVIKIWKWKADWLDTLRLWVWTAYSQLYCCPVWLDCILGKLRISGFLGWRFWTSIFQQKEFLISALRHRSPLNILGTEIGKKMWMVHLSRKHHVFLVPGTPYCREPQFTSLCKLTSLGEESTVTDWGMRGMGPRSPPVLSVDS